VATRSPCSAYTLARVFRLGCCPDTVAHPIRPSPQYLRNQAIQLVVLTDDLLLQTMARTTRFVRLVVAVIKIITFLMRCAFHPIYVFLE
jgi:hypothetical protein